MSRKIISVHLSPMRSSVQVIGQGDLLVLVTVSFILARFLYTLNYYGYALSAGYAEDGAAGLFVFFFQGIDQGHQQY